MQNDIYQNLINVDYFNLEISSCQTTLVINASQQGIKSFLKDFGSLEKPPEFVEFKIRPERIWSTRFLQKRDHVSANDLTLFKGVITEKRNTLYNKLNIKFLELPSESYILSASFEEKSGPLLVVNQKGWIKFLEILQHLLEENYWFYVTTLRDKISTLPFVLTPIKSNHLTFQAIECIRLEPEQQIYLNFDLSADSHVMITGNSAGLLLFSKWLHELISDIENTQKFLNPWNDIFKSVRIKDRDKSDVINKQTLHLTKCCLDKPYPVIAFGCSAKDASELHVYCNLKGLKELSELFEQAAFSHDHDEYYLKPFSRRLRGDLSDEADLPESIHLMTSWGLLEGAFYNPAYYSQAKAFFDDNFLNDFEEEANQFINKKIIKY